MSLYAVLSDIHGNLYALEKIYKDMKSFEICGVILLGDLIDYGMQSNEVVNFLENRFDYKIVCSIWGNHERAIMTSDFTNFSSSRGIDSARYTASILNEKTKRYLDTSLRHEGVFEFFLNEKSCLAVHGSLENSYWKSIFPDDVCGDYSKYDIVFSGHSHYSHVFTKFYDSDNIKMRNKHAVKFINPGSVGQPRNHHSQAQYALIDIDTLSVSLRSISYEVDKAMSIYRGDIDNFYRDRLKNGV